MNVFLADLRHGARRLRHSPGFTAVSILTLALGIGAATAIFSAVNPILLEPLPYPRANRIVQLSDFGAGGVPIDATYGTYEELRSRARSLEALAVADAWRPALTGTDDPAQLAGQRVSSTFFRTLGVAPALGHDFTEADDQPGAAPVAIVTAGLAKRRLGGDSAILGHEIMLDGLGYTVIGVMPRDFENVIAPAAEVWTPLRYRAAAPFASGEWGHHMRMAGRLAPDATLDGARRELLQIGATPEAEFPRPPWANLKGGMIVHALQDDVTREVRPALLVVLGAVLLLLAIACVNVANLLLGRGAQRRSEFAVRAALGAGRGRLVAQLITESVLLAAAGGALGLAVAGAGVRAFVALSPPGLPRPEAIHLNLAAAAFAAGITTLIGVVVGVAPALDAARADLREGLQQASRRAAGGRRHVRRALVAGEVALALVLLVGAGLLLRSVERLLAVAPGFEAAHVLTMQIDLVGPRYKDDSTKYRALEQELDAVRAVPGVTAAAFTSQLPLSDEFEKYGYEFASAPAQDANQGQEQTAFRYAVTPDYFAAMRVPLLRGRLLDASDVTGGVEAIVISQTFARRKFPGADPIGQQLRFGPELGDKSRPWDVVVGVVGDVKQASLAQGDANAFYVATPRWRWVDNSQSLVVRAGGDVATLVPAIRRALWSVEKDQPITRVSTMSALVAASAGDRRFVLMLLEAFALAALALAALGTYGVLAAGVAERVREMGVRAALGASRGEILAMVMREGMALTLVGVAVGLAGAVATSRALVTMLFGVTRLDAVTYLGVVVLLTGVSAAACLIPAWRAARVDPTTALRAE